jgi:regulatory protein spx
MFLTSPIPVGEVFLFDWSALMIHIYTRTGCNSSHKAIKWLQTFQIPYQHHPISHMTVEDFYHILSLTEGGLEDILVQSKPIENQETLNIEELKVKDVLVLMHKYPRFFKSPIIVGEKKLAIGWNAEDIRQFLSKDFRKIERDPG